MVVQTRTLTGPIRYRCELGVLALDDVFLHGMVFRDVNDCDLEEKAALLRLLCFMVRSATSPGYRRTNLYEHDTYLSLFDTGFRRRIANLPNFCKLKQPLVQFLKGRVFPMDVDLVRLCMGGTNFDLIVLGVGISIRRNQEDGRMGFVTIDPPDPSDDSDATVRWDSDNATVDG
jgi:hypothetical protein